MNIATDDVAFIVDPEGAWNTTYSEIYTVILETRKIHVETLNW